MTGALPLAAALLAAGAVLTWPAPTHCGDKRRPVAIIGEPQPTTRGADRAAHRRALPVRDLLGRLRLRLRRSGGHAQGVREVQLLDGLAAALEAGLPVERAVQVALTPVAERGAPGPWAELARSAGDGQPLGPAWQRLARRSGSVTAAPVARAWTVASATGAPLAAAVRASAHAARERHRLERAVEVATAGARATARVLGLLPLGGVALAAVLGIGPASLYAHPLATASAVLGLVLLLTGHLLVRRMVRGVLGAVT